MAIRALVAAVLCLLTLFHVGVLGHDLQPRALGIADIPPCGIRCILITLPTTACTLDNTDCFCTDQNFALSNAACLLANCTMSDILGTAKVQANMCNLSNESKRHHVFWYTGVVYAVGILFVVLRMAGKLASKRLSVDDWVLILALLLGAIPIGCVLKMGTLGFGEHLWNLEDGKLLEILRLFYVCSSTYTVILCLTKVSLILFFLQIFHTPRFKLFAYIVLAYIIINSLVIFFMTVFACAPVSAFWNQDINGHCLNVTELALANSASSIAQDFMLLLLPIPFISTLQMKTSRKISVILVFAIGSLGCITTILRLRSLRSFKVSIDPSWDYVTVTIWTELELLAAITCVSLPPIRLLLVRILPTRFKKFFTQKTNSNRSKSNPAPQSDVSRQWKKPATWMTISTMPGESMNGTSKSFGNDSWIERSAIRHSSQRLHSALSDDSDHETAEPRSPFDEMSPHDNIEMYSVAEPGKTHARRDCTSCGSFSDRATALPTMGDLGCLPERTYSNTPYSSPVPDKTFEDWERKWLR
ncbi:hypothetical protein P153DRAFT_377123 [Dothidotthia symphoricarpi CBS 119687]|uniref:Uncharacterized protein n=1 Tax=Dothidotthia symphoricarpi CBS 119687 TaxID=1392245 RepID=A0A6A6A6S9_9PLEO|nr:uncharacterized protein P153DRAFT_377123 [Dothidotthia symphoricarpi CBS 119687]KAF2127520.1 hypothetical protein P153DRAFT_377123 [Dothidotthia symphoricarpi CBS 119687]